MTNKKITFKILAGFFALTSIILMSFFAYQMIVQAQTKFATVDENGSTTLNTLELEDYIESLPAPALTPSEIDGIVYMAEEEKLARDVYLFLYEFWGEKIFDNIKRSEETHMYAVDLLVDKYNLTNNVNYTEIGVFNNQILQDLYDDLVSIGQNSLIDALEVGAAIEEIDIIDLVKYMDDTDKEDILFVYDLLLMGSRNHLRAFVKNLSNNGDSYTPQFLDQADYDNILAGDLENNDQTSPYLFLLGSIIGLLIGFIFFMQSKNQPNSTLENSYN